MAELCVMLVRHLRENAVAWARFLRAPPEDLPSKLRAVGVVTCGVAACAAVSLPPDADGDGDGVAQLLTHHCGRLGAAVLTFIGGLWVIWAAFWVEAAAPRRGAAGHLILIASLGLLLVAIALSGSENFEVVFNIVFGAIQA